MARPQLRDPSAVQPIFHDRPRRLYWVERQEDVWFIGFDGADYGPYKTEREALLFAVDAAKTLGEQGEETWVLLVDENGDVQPAWTFGQDPYPPHGSEYRFVATVAQALTCHRLRLWAMTSGDAH